MPAIVNSVLENSIAEELEIKQGDEILSIDGNVMLDMIDYNFYCKSDFLSTEVKKTNGEIEEIEIEKPEENNNAQIFEGMNFVITGSVEHFANRNEVKAVIEERGGKVTGSVTSKTNYLINNDTTSNSGKNKKAKELGVAIISEEDFMNLI